MQQSWVTKLSEALRLQPFSQDWGICNSDPLRIEEFLSFYESNAPDSPWESEALADLLLQSLNEALEAGILSQPQRALALLFLRNHSHEFPHQLSYWATLTPSEADPWPILALIQEAGVAA